MNTNTHLDFILKHMDKYFEAFTKFLVKNFKYHFGKEWSWENFENSYFVKYCIIFLVKELPNNMELFNGKIKFYKK